MDQRSNTLQKDIEDLKTEFNRKDQTLANHIDNLKTKNNELESKLKTIIERSAKGTGRKILEGIFTLGLSLLFTGGVTFTGDDLTNLKQRLQDMEINITGFQNTFSSMDQLLNNIFKKTKELKNLKQINSSQNQLKCISPPSYIIGKVTEEIRGAISSLDQKKADEIQTKTEKCIRQTREALVQFQKSQKEIKEELKRVTLD